MNKRMFNFSFWKTVLLLSLYLNVLETDRARGDTDKPVVIMIASKESIEDSRNVAKAVRGQLSDFDVSLHLEWVDTLEPQLPSQVALARRVAENKKALAVFWSDLSLPDQVFIYIAEPGGGRILVRGLQKEGEKKQGRVEAMALIVRYAVRAMLEGGQIGVSMPGPATVEKEKIKKVSGLIEASFSYGLAMFSADNMALHGARVAVSVRIYRWVRVFLGYRIQTSMNFDIETVSMSLKPHPMEIGFALRLERKGWIMDGGAALVVDRVTWSITPKREDVSPVSPYARWLAGLSPYVMIGWSPAPFSTIFFSAAADIYFSRRDYVVRDPGGEVVVACPWRVRPFFQIGAMFSFF